MVTSPRYRALTAPGWTRDPLWTRARMMPSFDIDANFSALPVDRISGQNLTTFTRAASATYVDVDGVIRTAGANVLRRQWDATNQRWGWLVEEARTNLLLRSEEFNGASWTKANTTVTVNQATAPDGSANADLIAGDAGTAIKYIYGFYSASTSGAFTFSVFAKAGTESFIVARITDQGGVNEVRQRFDLSSGTLNGSVAVGGTATAGSSSISAVGNGWYRCAVTATFAAFTQLQGNVWLNSYASTSLATNFYLWGTQLEAGAFPTSYIPTGAATATRDADVWSVTGTNFSRWYRQDEGTFFVVTQLASTSARNAAVFDANDASTNNRIILRGFTTGSVDQAVIRSAASTVATLSSISSPGLSQRKTAVSTVADAFAMAADGALAPIDSSGAMPLSVSQLLIGYGQGGGEQLNGTISRLTYWPARLSNPVLQELSR